MQRSMAQREPGKRALRSQGLAIQTISSRHIHAKVRLKKIQAFPPKNTFFALFGFSIALPYNYSK
jgi:hypothetical protein